MGQYQLRKKILKSLWPLLTVFSPSLTKLVILRVILLSCSLLTPIVYKMLVDDVMINKQFYLMKWIVMSYIGLFIVESIVIIFDKKHSNKINHLISVKLRKVLMGKIFKFYFNKFEKYSTGDLKNRVNDDVELLEGCVETQFTEYYYNYVLVIIVSISIMFINWKLAIVAILMIPLSFWMTNILGSNIKIKSEEYRKIYGEYENWLKESIQEWKEIKCQGIEKRKELTFIGYWHRLSKIFFSKQMSWTYNRTFLSFKDFFITRLNLYFLGGLFIVWGELSVGGLLVFMKYYEMIFSSLAKVNELDLQLQDESPGIERILEVYTYNENQTIHRVPDKIFEGEIHFNNVDFSYDGEKEIIKNVSFKIRPKECISIVGRTGSGKTTIIKMLIGMLKPTNGEIIIDNKFNLNYIDPSIINKEIAVIMQDPMIFNMSIKDNLLLACPETSEEELWKVCKLANINQFIERLPDGIDTKIGERGMMLSGGQRQRIAIARALLLKPSILILDESTSQLDNETEKYIQHTLVKLKDKMTIIIIAHKVNAIEISDRIIMINDGSITLDDQYGKRIEKKESYRTLFSV